MEILTGWGSQKSKFRKECMGLNWNFMWIFFGTTQPLTGTNDRNCPLTGINEFKIILFGLYHLTVLVYTKTTIFLIVGG